MELGSETNCVGVVVAKVKEAETHLEENEKQENLNRTADIGTVERQNNSIIHDVINEVEEKSLSDIQSKIGNIKETLASLNSTDQIETVFKEKIRELNATIQSFREETVPKSEAVVGLPVVMNWPESESVKDGGEEESEEVLFQLADQRDDSEIIGEAQTQTESTTPDDLEQNKVTSENLSEYPVDSEIVGKNFKKAGIDRDGGNRVDRSQRPPEVEMEAHSQKSSEETQQDSKSRIGDVSSPNLEETTRSPFADAPLWIPKSATFPPKTSFPKNLGDTKSEPIFTSTNSTSKTHLSTTVPTSTVLVSNSTPKAPTSANPVTASSLSSTTLSDTPASSSYNLSATPVPKYKSPSSRTSLPWVQGSCDEGQLECREGGCVRKVILSRRHLIK